MLQFVSTLRTLLLLTTVWVGTLRILGWLAGKLYQVNLPQSRNFRMEPKY